MALFGRRDDRGRPGGPSPLSQRSLALPRLLALLPERSASVLDLGAANPQNIQFFAGRGAQITVADLYRSAIPARRGGARPPAVFRKLLTYEPATHFDLVLAWDVLNYLQTEELSNLMMGLESFLRPGSYLHALVSARGEMPQTPAVYRIEDEATLGLEPAEGASRPSPGYLEPTLLKSMAGLAVESRFQLRNGSVEYAFSYRKRPPEASLTAATPRARLERENRWRRAPSR